MHGGRSFLLDAAWSEQVSVGKLVIAVAKVAPRSRSTVRDRAAITRAPLKLTIEIISQDYLDLPRVLYFWGTRMNVWMS